MKTKLIIYALAALNLTNGTRAQSHDTVPVTIENYNRAQTDVYFVRLLRLSSRGSFGLTATRCIRSPLSTSMPAR